MEATTSGLKRRRPARAAYSRPRRRARAGTGPIRSWTRSAGRGASRRRRTRRASPPDRLRPATPRSEVPARSRNLPPCHVRHADGCDHSARRVGGSAGRTDLRQGRNDPATGMLDVPLDGDQIGPGEVDRRLELAAKILDAEKYGAPVARVQSGATDRGMHRLTLQVAAALGTTVAAVRRMATETTAAAFPDRG